MTNRHGNHTGSIHYQEVQNFLNGRDHRSVSKEQFTTNLTELKNMIVKAISEFKDCLPEGEQAAFATQSLGVLSA